MMRVGVVQMRSGCSIADNCSAMEQQIREAAAQGAQYVQTPEMTGIVQRNPKHLFAEISNAKNDPLTKLASSLAKELEIWLHIGSHAIDLGTGKAANRALLFSPTGVCETTYDKIHMFDVDLDNGESWRESKVYEAGSEAVSVDIDGIKFGLSICYDIRFPHLYRSQSLAGAKVLTAPAAFTRQTGKAHWHILQRARAIENGAFVISAAQGGEHEDGRETFGHSIIINPWGEVIGEVEGEEPGIAVVDIDLAEVDKARGKIPNLKNSRQFGITNITGGLEAAE